MSLLSFPGSGIHTISTVVGISCVLTVLAITYDRFLGICNPMNTYPTWRQISMKRIITTIWVSACATGFPEMFCFQNPIADIKPTSLNLRFTLFYQTSPRVFHFLISCLFFITLLICLHYIARMIATLSKKRKRTCGHSTRSHWKTIALLVTVAITFCACLLPHYTLRLLTAVDPGIFIRHIGFDQFAQMLEILQILVFVHSALHPIIYNFTSTKFNVAFKKVLRMRTSMGWWWSEGYSYWFKHYIMWYLK